MTRIRGALVAISLVVLLAPFSRASDKSLARQRAQADQLSPSVLVHRPIDEVLNRFAKQVAVYVAIEGLDKVTIELDFLGNDSANDKLPSDMGQFTRDVIARIGNIQTYRTLPSGILSSRASSLALPQLLKERPKPPPPDFRLVGQIERATEVMVKYRNGRADATGGGGHSSTDSSLTADRSQSITALTIGMTLERPDGVDVPGATAEYRIDVKEMENNNGFSLYVGGNGFSFGSRLKISQDWADAVYDALAMSIVQIAGNAFKVPYYNCSSNFEADIALKERVRSDFTHKTQSQLERLVKNYLIVSGHDDIDRSKADLTSEDRKVVALEMQRLHLPVVNTSPEQAHVATVDLLMQLWQNLDYAQAATRAESILDLNDWTRNETQEKQVALNVTPGEFGWPANEPIVVLDLSRIESASQQRQILRAIQLCTRCGEIRSHPQKPLLGIRTNSQDAVQQAIRRSGVSVQYVWLGTAVPRLLVTPLQVK